MNMNYVYGGILAGVCVNVCVVCMKKLGTVTMA